MSKHTTDADLEDWKYEVANGDTVLGFQEWNQHRAESEEGGTRTK